MQQLELPTLLLTYALVIKAHTSFEHTQILTKLEWHLTTNHQSKSRSAPLYISIFLMLNMNIYWWIDRLYSGFHNLSCNKHTPKCALSLLKLSNSYFNKHLLKFISLHIYLGRSISPIFRYSFHLSLTLQDSWSKHLAYYLFISQLYTSWSTSYWLWFATILSVGFHLIVY